MYSERLSVSLMTFFSSTTVSAAIVESLGHASNALGADEILLRVRDIRHLELPRTAVESSLILLAEAGFIVSADGSYHLTDTGEELARKLSSLHKLPSS
jgi:hypothetical protein